MKRIFSAALFFCVLTSCATSTQTVLPSGNVGHIINCSGTAVVIAQCYKKAGEVCPNGYNVISSHNERGVATGLYGTQYATSDKGLLIECK